MLLKGVYNLAKGILDFFVSMFSDNGIPSSSRLIMLLFSSATIKIMLIIANRLVSISDPVLLAIWLQNIPLIAAALIGLITAPYAINRGAEVAKAAAEFVSNVRTLYRATKEPVTPEIKNNLQIKIDN